MLSWLLAKKSGIITNLLYVTPISVLKSKVNSSQSPLITELATLTSFATPPAPSNLTPTSVAISFLTISLTILLFSSKVKAPISSLITKAQGFPAAFAVNLATLAEVFAPSVLGLSTISSAGLESF